MNDEGSALGEEQMRGKQGFGVPLDGIGEVGLGPAILDPVIPRSESSKMGGEAMKVFKRKSQLSAGTGGESDDDGRPICSLFGLKKRRVGRKAKPSEPEARAENPRTEKGDSGEIHETLAILKKKLKGPKWVKDAGGGGSGAVATAAVEDSSPLDELGELKPPEDADSGIQLEFEENSKNKRSRNTAAKKNDKMRISGLLHSSDLSLDAEAEVSLSVFLQRAQAGSAQRARLSSKKMKPVERTLGTHSELNQSSGEVPNDTWSPLFERPSSVDGVFSLPSDRALKGPGIRRRGRKPRGGRIGEMKAGAGVGEHLGQISNDEGLGLVVKQRGRKPRGGRIAEVKLVAGVDDHLGRISNDEGLGLVVGRRGRKLRGGRIAEMKLGAGVDDHLGRISNDEGLGPVVGRRGRKPRDGRIAEMKLGAEVDDHLGRISNDEGLGLVGKRRGRKPRGGRIADMKVGAEVDKHLGPISNDDGLGLVDKRRGRRRRGGSVAEMKVMGTVVDEHLDWISHDETLGLDINRMVRKHSVDFDANMEEVGTGDDDHLDRFPLNESLGLVFRRRGRKSFDCPVAEMEEVGTGVDEHLDQISHGGSSEERPSFVVGKSCSSRTVEDSLSGVVQESSSISFLEVNLENSVLVNNLNPAPNGSSTEVFLHQAKEQTLLAENDSKHCSNGNLNNFINKVVDNSTSSHPTWANDGTGFEPCPEKFIEDIPQTIVPISSPVKDFTHEPSGNIDALVQDSCSVLSLEASEELVKSGDMLDKSIDWWKDPCKLKANENIITQKVSEKNELSDEPLELSVGNLKESRPSLDLNSKSLITVQVVSIFHHDDSMNEQNAYLSQCLSSPDCGTKEEDVHNYCDGFKQPLMKAPITDESPPNSVPVQPEDNLRSDDGKKVGDIRNYIDGSNQQLTYDPISDKSPLILVPLQAEENSQSDDGFPRSSSENWSIMASLSDCCKKDEYVHIYSDRLNQPPPPYDHISDKTPYMPVPMRTEEKLRSDELPKSSRDINFDVLCGTDDYLNQFVEGEQVIIQSLDDASKEPSSYRSQDLFTAKDSDAACSPTVVLDPKETDPVDAAVVFDHYDSVPRAMRVIKKHRHSDMAYEGDVDWEVLMHEQRSLINMSAVDGDHNARTEEKPEPFSDVMVDATSGSIAAVAAGLKSCAAGPIEKIKFKDVLKRKSGLLEYLDCRNIILGLWSKDVKHILPLVDCGVSDVPIENESPRSSLTREIYMFLDRNGYINAGIASETEPTRYGLRHFESSKEYESKESRAKISSSKDEVASAFENFKISDHVIQCKDAHTQESMTPFDALNSNPSLEIFDCGINPVVSPEQIEVSCDIHRSTGTEREMLAFVEKEGVESTAGRTLEVSRNTKFDSVVRKRIIVVGAGPAGLTATRHLQRQGFSVVVLEARDRIGGRVHTDRSSLSVPVDLGASIITGVEADVATERRPDPSSLICSQLGLELTVLNSDCPLYDIVTGDKVPADLDEALEAEYNSLLDDMVLLVAQNGESAMRMSLEDGLEYALRRRCTARSASFSVDSDQSKVASDYGTVDALMNVSADTTNLLSPLERRVMDWHFANLEYGCAALLKEVSLPYWNQDDAYGGFGGAHCMIRGGYSTVVESIGKGLDIHLNHVVTEVMYNLKDSNGTGQQQNKVKIISSNGSEFIGDAVLITVPLGCLKENTIRFSPTLPDWKQSSIQKLGFGVLNKVVLEFTEVFWDDTVDYFGATAEETDCRGQCFMFWNVKKTVGAPVLIALVVGKAAIDGQSISPSDHVNHALMVLRKLFGETSVPDPVASVVTNWGVDPFSRGAYSYVALGASGEDYDILGKPVANCLFFAGEATCKEHPDTVGGAMMSGLREAVRIIDILNTGKDNVAEVEAMEAVQRHSDSERSEVRDISTRLEACKLSHVLCKNSSNGLHTLITKEALLQDMFSSAKTTSGRLHLAKEFLRLPVEALKSFAGTKEGLSTLNSWILDSLGKNATQLLRHCVRLLVLISTDLLAVRLSGIGRTVKEKVCVHTSRDIRAIASQLVNMWIEVFRKEKAANSRLKSSRQTTAPESSKIRSKDMASAKPTPRITNESSDDRANNKKTEKITRLESLMDTKSEANSVHSQSIIQGVESRAEDNMVMSEEAAAVFAAAEVARAAALAAAEAYATSEADIGTLRELPKIPSFHKFARREQSTQMDESDIRRKWSGGILGRQDCLSEIDSRNCRVRNWSVDFAATYGNPDGSKMSGGDNYTQRSCSNDMACPSNPREHSGESGAIDSRLTRAWADTDTAGSGGVKDSLAIERWQSQAMDADADFFNHMYVMDEEDSNIMLQQTPMKNLKQTEESSASQVADNKSSMKGQPRGAEHIKQGIVDYVASLLMPLYKTKKIDKEGYKSIMKKTTTKVFDQCTAAEKMMTVVEFLDFRRKNKIRSFVDKLIEKHMAVTPSRKS